MFLSCSGGDEVKNKVYYNSINDVSTEAWKELSQKTIYFGHQSVGFNIIDGINDLKKENPNISLNIVEIKTPDEMEKHVFAHSRIGANNDPSQKITDFKKYIENGVGDKANIAFLKFCYVDIHKDSDTAKVFSDYNKMILDVQKEFPKTTFVHFTVPLTVSKTNWKTWFKKTMGKGELWEINDNIKRNEYNELVINQYDKKEPVFDLAKIESTDNENNRVSFSYKDKTYYSMFPGYTNDGGHLNENGRKKIAEQLLLFLINLN